VDFNWKRQAVESLCGGLLTIHPSEQTVSSLSRTEGMTLGVGFFEEQGHGFRYT
jgi:hypothetical protein